MMSKYYIIKEIEVAIDMHDTSKSKLLGGTRNESYAKKMVNYLNEKTSNYYKYKIESIEDIDGNFIKEIIKGGKDGNIK